jgi:DNA-binding IclR family transcriptional regulator
MKSSGTSARRALRILSILQGHSLDGLSNGEIAKALGESPANVSRAVDVLVDEGFATRLDTGRVGLGIKLAQIGVRHLNELELAERRIKELKQRTMAGAVN